MDIKDRYTLYHDKSREILDATVARKCGINLDLAQFIFEIESVERNPHVKKLYQTICLKFETASYLATIGLYDQAMSTLRMGFELYFATINFSFDALFLHEWINGIRDVYWSQIVDDENGILSKRFCNAFLPEAKNSIESFNRDARNAYRSLSEYIHNGYDLSQRENLKIEYSESKFDAFISRLSQCSKIIKYISVVRYFGDLNELEKDRLESNIEELKYIPEIRIKFGGAGEI